MNVQRKALLTALDALKPFADSRNTIPILSSVRLGMSRGRLEFECSDFESLRRTSIDCDGEIVPVCIDVAKLLDVVKALSGDVVTLEVGGDYRTSIRCGKSQFKLVGVEPIGWPSIDMGGDAVEFEVEDGYLETVRNAVEYAIARDDSRYGINGACLEHNDTDRRWVATDGHRLAMTGPDVEGNVSIVQRKFLTGGAKMAGGTVRLTKERITLTSGNDLLSCRLLEGDFPDYRQVVPRRDGARVEVAKPEIIGALKRVSLLASEKTIGVRFTFDGTTLLMTAEDVDRGRAEEPVEFAPSVQSKIVMGFNGKYFSDALERCGDIAVIRLFDNKAPAIVEGDGSTHVIMPMRVE